MSQRTGLSLGVLLFFAVGGSGPAAVADDAGRIHRHTAGETLTVVEMNHGDELRFTLRNGEERTFVLEKTSARFIEQPRGGIVYSFDCHLRADGQPLVLRRYVSSQETFYEPWVINGVRLWLSSSQSVFSLVPIRYPEAHHALDADATVALQDATLPICPEPMRPWFPIERHFIDVGDCYNGDDPWLGPYLGEACHVGLDINMPKGTPLYAPIGFDDHWIFSADHRWRGVRRWENGDVWGLQSHHVDKLLLDEHTPIAPGAHYAEAAGKGVGSHPHSHFEFRLGREVMNPGRLGGIEIDPWILFWQIFETDRAAKGRLSAMIEPVAPAEAGRAVRFSSKTSGGDEDAELRFTWTFGDGGSSREAAPEHVFCRPGVYPVTLVVDDGRNRVTHTQHITIRGEAVERPALVLRAPDDVTFRPRPAPVADVYGWPVRFLPHTIRLAVAPSTSAAAEVVRRRVELVNIGGGDLPPAASPQIEYVSEEVGDWLRVEQAGQGNAQEIIVTVDRAALPVGRHEAVVTVACPGAVNGRQAFGVEVTVRPTPDVQEVVVDDRDDGCYATPYFWVGHQFLRSQERGHRQRYLTNGGRAVAGEFVRFTPDLAAGRYEVAFHEDAPLRAGSRVPVRIRHASGEASLAFEPGEGASRSLGEYTFHSGTDGFMELHAEGSRGSVVADAVVFRRIAEE